MNDSLGRSADPPDAQSGDALSPTEPKGDAHGEESGSPSPADPSPPAAPPPAEKTGKQKKKKKRMPLLLRFFIKLSLLSLVLILVFSYVLGVRIYHGNRMHPFLMDGDLLITYKLDAYQVGDVVVYRNPVSGEIGLSRIVAVGGQAVEITELGALLVDGYSPPEQVFYATKPLEGSELRYPCPVPENAFFLLDDYREIGLDSRAFGPVPADALLGKVVYVLRRRGI